MANSILCTTERKKWEWGREGKEEKKEGNLGIKKLSKDKLALGDLVGSQPAHTEKDAKFGIPLSRKPLLKRKLRV